MATVFVYGTLMADEVVRALIHRVPRARPAVVSGYRRHALRGQVFPGTVPAGATDTVTGKVLFDLTPPEMSVFDAFEGDEYYKAAVSPRLLDGGGEEAVAASIYLWHDSLRGHLLPQEWDYDAWRLADLDRYAAMCREFAADLAEDGGGAAASAAAREGQR